MNIALNMQNKRLKNLKHCIQIKCFLLQSSNIPDLENNFNLKIIPTDFAIKTSKSVKLLSFSIPPLLVNKCWQRTSLNLPHIFKMYSHKLKEGFSFKFSQYKIYSWSSTLSWCQPHLIQERLASSKCCQDFHCLPNMSLFY